MKNEPSQKQDFTVDDFIKAIREFRTQAFQMMELWHEYITGYAEHPGMSANMNLFMDPQGRIWTHVLNGFKRHYLNPTFMERIRIRMGTEEIVAELPEGTTRGQLEPWVWERPSWAKSDEEALEHTFKQILSHVRYVKQCQQSIVFAEYLLKENRRSELQTWFDERAQTSDRKKDAHMDEQLFFEKFGKDAGFDDYEQVYQLLTNIIMELHRLLDTLAGQADIVRWY